VTVQSTDSGNKYLLNGVQQDDPVLYPGGVYTFDQSDSSNDNHPFRFSTTSNGSHGGGSTYSTGVEVNGTPGNSGAYTRITVSASTPTPLYYYCTQHSGMGNFVTIGKEYSISNNSVIIDPTSDLTAGETYHINYPSGIFTNSSGDLDYVGTAYTFGVKPTFAALFAWGYNVEGFLGQNDRTQYSSPIQIPGTTWASVIESNNTGAVGAIKTDGTLWMWGDGSQGELAQNNQVDYSSPVQVPGTTWGIVRSGSYFAGATKTDGTLWAWGNNTDGRLGQNSQVKYSSPVQVPGTYWHTGDGDKMGTHNDGFIIIKSTGQQLWAWGANAYGQLGTNNTTYYSSPVQIPGTTWSAVSGGSQHSLAIKTDGTLWAWGRNTRGPIGQNNRTTYSSPEQIPGTTWAKVHAAGELSFATKTDGTLWAWGRNDEGYLGQNNAVQYSSPVQVGSDTTWSDVSGFAQSTIATKTDGTLWTWGQSGYGRLGLNTNIGISSPTQIPGTTWTGVMGASSYATLAIKNI
jgi:alpha-tubulin suppressor-like RCC1 family protein